MYNDKELQKAVLAVMLGKKESVEEAKKPLHPNQQKLDVHEPEKDELTAKDFEMLRAGKKAKKDGEMKEEIEQTDEAMSHQAKTTMKHIPNASPALKKAAKDIKPGIAGYRDRVDMLKSGGVKEATSMAQQAAIAIAKKKAMKEEVELLDDADETVFVHTPIEFEIKESYVFGDYLTAAKKLVGEEEAIDLANEKFKAQDVSIFAEEFMRSDIEDKVKSHEKAGHKVSSPKYMTKSGKPYAEYVVTDKESGVRRKYIHHGNARSVENMGAAGKKDE